MAGTPAAACALSVRNVTKTYRGEPAPAVDAICLDVQPGEIFTLLGPSGCGKTTTLRLIAGLERPDAGEIAFGDRIVTDPQTFVPPDQRRLGMMFQSSAVWPHMTVGENVAFPLKLRKISRQDVAARVRAVLELIGMPDFTERMTTSLSGGQLQRVALARALATDPEVLLLDEPFSSLDSALRLQMRRDVKRLQRQLGFAMIFVTHDQHEALSFSDRIAVMRDGAVLQTGAPQELYDRPATEFVRDFVGKSVLLKGHQSTAGPHAGVVLDGSNHTLQVESPVAPGEHCVVACRPEDLAVHPSLPGSAGCHLLSGTIADVRFAGKRIEYRVDVVGQGPIEVYGDRHRILELGDPVSLTVHPVGCTVWPAEP